MSSLVVASAAGERPSSKKQGGGTKPALTTMVLGVLVLSFLVHDMYFEERNFRDAATIGKSSTVTAAAIISCNQTAATTETPASSKMMSELLGPYMQRNSMEQNGFLLTPQQQHPSAKMFQPDPFFQRIYDKVDSFEDEAARCKQYGFAYTPGTQRRRIFFGALVADDSKDVIQVHATETYGIYHTIAMLESNTTFVGMHRDLRFAPGLDLYQYVTSGVFGGETQVFVDLWLEDAKDAKGMLREAIQRESIIHRWKQQGMRPDDIGLVGDIDEFFSRDFLRAAQVCDIKEFEEPHISNCKRPKIVAHGIVYESSPECWKYTKWFHPDMMLGECIDKIGDPTGRVVSGRDYHRTRGHRESGYDPGKPGGYLSHIVSSGLYPLWSTQDFRSIEGGQQYRWVNHSQEGSDFGTSFHVHNFFDDLQVLRHKYSTYGHANHRAVKVPLSNISPALDVVVRCVHDLPNKANPQSAVRIVKPFNRSVGPKPIFFLNESYRKARHEHVRDIVLADEKQFGSIYSEAGERNKTASELVM
jgi:hypothetical protein